MKAHCLIREAPPYRREAFVEGLKAAGYEVCGPPRDTPKPEDALIIWNRYGRYDSHAREFDRVGAKVFVAENGYLGRDWRGGHWYALARNYHNGAGDWKSGGGSRWDKWGVELAPMREGGEEIVVLATRHIGPINIAEPPAWVQRMVPVLERCYPKPIRVRPHPGEGPSVPLEEDLAKAEGVVTWGSGAALKALILGIPVWYGFAQWIGAPAGTHVGRFPFQSKEGDKRLDMFQRLAWAMWEVEEIATGVPFARL